MAGRLILLKHIQYALPTYSLMIMAYTRHGYQKLEAICREFLLGYSIEGKSKHRLVAWEKIVRPFAQGGLGIHPFSSFAQTLKLQKITKLLQQHPIKWVSIVEASLQKSLRHGLLGHPSIIGLPKNIYCWVLQSISSIPLFGNS